MKKSHQIYFLYFLLLLDLRWEVLIFLRCITKQCSQTSLLHEDFRIEIPKSYLELNIKNKLNWGQLPDLTWIIRLVVAFGCACVLWNSCDLICYYDIIYSMIIVFTNNTLVRLQSDRECLIWLWRYQNIGNWSQIYTDRLSRWLKWQFVWTYWQDHLPGRKSPLPSPGVRCQSTQDRPRYLGAGAEVIIIMSIYNDDDVMNWYPHSHQSLQCIHIGSTVKHLTMGPSVMKTV